MKSFIKDNAQQDVMVQACLGEVGLGAESSACQFHSSACDSAG